MFLAVLVVHVPFGLACVLTGSAAALSPKRAGPHPRLGATYHWCLVVVCVTSVALAGMHWSRDRLLFLLAVVSLGAAGLGGRAARRARPGWVPVHILRMSDSYVVLLTAFSLDNAQNLPLWRELPTVVFWFLPTAVAAPLVVRALSRYRTPEPPTADTRLVVRRTGRA